MYENYLLLHDQAFTDPSPCEGIEPCQIPYSPCFSNCCLLWLTKANLSWQCAWMLGSLLAQ